MPHYEFFLKEQERKSIRKWHDVDVIKKDWY